MWRQVRRRGSDLPHLSKGPLRRAGSRRATVRPRHHTGQLPAQDGRQERPPWPSRPGAASSSPPSPCQPATPAWPSFLLAPDLSCPRPNQGIIRSWKPDRSRIDIHDELTASGDERVVFAFPAARTIGVSVGGTAASLAIRTSFRSAGARLARISRTSSALTTSRPDWSEDMVMGCLRPRPYRCPGRIRDLSPSTPANRRRCRPFVSRGPRPWNPAGTRCTPPSWGQGSSRSRRCRTRCCWRCPRSGA